MSFVVIGLNHITAPLNVLEQVSIGADDLPKALHDLHQRPHISEAVVLSTCSRTEVYVEAERFHGAFQDIRDFLCVASHLPPERLADTLYAYHDDQAIEHLFRVSSGVDSAVVGEHEILGQIKRAWQASLDSDCCGANLNAAFRAAIETGKRVRTETTISEHVASVSQAAILLAESKLQDTESVPLDHAKVLLIGAGEMGAGMALSLADRSSAEITVVSRTTGTADVLAQRIGASVAPFADLDELLTKCDVAFTSTAAPSLVIDADRLAKVAAARSGSSLLIVDIAMPRDVESSASAIDGIELLDIERVNAFVARGIDSRSAEIGEATQIIDSEVARFAERVGQQSVVPLLTEFRSRAETLRSAELTRQANRLAHLSDADRVLVDEVTRAVLAKVLHEPTVRLKDAATSLRGERLATALRELFDLDLD